MKLLVILQGTVLFLIIKTSVADSLVEGIAKNHTHPYGRPINLMKTDTNESIVIDTELLGAILSQPDVADRKIVAISIVGAFRKGKSFLLDYALRYMYANYKSVAYPDNPLANKRDWVGNPDEPLTGFSWRSGSSIDTTGVVIWSDVFLHEYQNIMTKEIEKLAIILIDTQGLFNTKSTPEENSRIFALGTLISSQLIFNLNDVIQEDQLEYLQISTDFAKIALKKNRQADMRNNKPFQTLIFLMRDWQNEHEYEYGQAGGSQYLAKVLNIQPNQPKPLQEIREFIENSFEQRMCFLLPHPGSAVNNKQYDGRFSELNEIFKIHLKDFLNWILAPKNLKKKKILNSEVNGIEYLEYLKAYFEAFQSSDIPQVETIHAITVRKQYDIIISAAFSEYKRHFNSTNFKNENGELRTLEDIQQEMDQTHQAAIANALEIFRGKRKMGSRSDKRKYEEQLKTQINEYFIDWMHKELDAFSSLKAFNDQNNVEIRLLNENKEKELLKQRMEAEQERKRLEEMQRNNTFSLQIQMAEVKNKSAQEIEAINREFEKIKNEAENQRQLLINQLENEKLKIQQKATETKQQVNNELLRLQQEIKNKEEAARKIIEDKKAERLEALRIQAEEQKVKAEMQLKLSESQEKVQLEQIKFDREQMLEEKRIREEAAMQHRLEREKAQKEEKEAEQNFLLQLYENEKRFQEEHVNVTKSIQEIAQLVINQEMLIRQEGSKSEGLFSKVINFLDRIF